MTSSPATTVADAPAQAAVATPTFYRIDSARVSLREYVMETKNPLVLLIAAILKVLRVRIPSSADDPAVDSLLPFEVRAEELPADAAERLAPAVREMEALGFVSPVYHAIDDVLHSTRTYLASMRREDGRAVGRVHLRVWAIRQPPKVVQYAEFITPLAGGRTVWSLASKADLMAPPECRVVRKTKATAGELWALHAAALSGEEVSPVRDEGELRQVEEEHHRLVTRFHVGRGVFAPRTEGDVARVAAKQRVREVAAAGGLPDGEVLAEIDRLQQKRSSWWNTVLILAVSLALFIGLGKSGSSPLASSWDVMGMLVGVLFVHELGHYLAMRVFGYRNLRMFFIPFFGAAVSGRHYNVVGWKKAIVSLAGPVPGIVAGAALGLVGAVLHKAGMVQVGLLALILNGFNLLPVLPLDGGWVAHTLVFSRNYILDAAFRVCAALLLIAGGTLAQQRFFLYIGISMLVALPASFKIARIVANLRRRQDLATVSPDGQTIPPEVAQVIIGEIRQAFPRGTTTKTVAQRTTQVFEALNARPPGWLATIGLGAVHVGSFLAAMLIAAILLVAQHAPDLGAFARAAAAAPKHSVVASAIQTWPGEEAAEDAGGVTVVATFGKPAQAAEAVDVLRRDLAEGVRARLFGDSVFVSIPAGDDLTRKKVLRLLQGRTKEVFVASAGFPAGLTMTAIAPNEKMAEGIEADVRAYFEVPFVARLIPPWASDDSRSPEERERNRVTRRTYGRVLSAGFTLGKDEELANLFKQIAKARREGDVAEAKRLAEEQQKAYAERRKKAIQAMREEGPEKVDVFVIDRYIALEQAAKPATAPASDAMDDGVEPGVDLAQFLDEIAPRMGQLPADSSSARGDRESVRYSAVTRNGLLLTFHLGAMADPFDAAPVIVRWLESRRCAKIKYAFNGAGLEEEDTEGR